jgi:hypothetical protein
MLFFAFSYWQFGSGMHVNTRLNERNGRTLSVAFPSLKTPLRLKVIKLF